MEDRFVFGDLVEISDHADLYEFGVEVYIGVIVFINNRVIELSNGERNRLVNLSFKRAKKVSKFGFEVVYGQSKNSVLRESRDGEKYRRFTKGGGYQDAGSQIVSKGN